MNHKYVAHALSKPSRDLLLEHVDGATFVEVPVVAGERGKSRNTLLNLKLIRYGLAPDKMIGMPRHHTGPRPTETHVTEDGRLVMAYVLAGYAESLILAGYRIEALGPAAIEAAARQILEKENAPDLVEGVPIAPALVVQSSPGSMIVMTGEASSPGPHKALRVTSR